MQDAFDPSVIIFALLAIFVLWKLRSVLGTRTGAEKPPPANPFLRSTGATNANAAKAANEDNVVPLPGAAPRPAESPAPAAAGGWGAYAEPGSRVATGLDAIAAADRSFDLERFIAGAKSAYEIIVTAFAAGDRETLRNLLEKDVFDSFAAAIAAREGRGESMTTTVVSIDKVGVFDAGLREGVMQITLRFMVALISATRDKQGECIEGDPDKTVNMVDIWTFARPAQSVDPNWKLIATQTGQ